MRPVPPVNGTQLAAPLPAFLGLASLKHRAAPAFTLSDARTDAPVSLRQLRGQVVVLTFMNAACNDICPVLASELRQAAAQLGPTAVPVTFLTVNADPLDLQTTTAAVLSQPTLAALPGWRFLTGSIKQLNPVWKDFGIAITADRSTGAASHNDLLYFIGANGRMAWRASPFADESPSGAFSLSAAEQARFGQGIAQYADKLAGSS